MNNCEEMKKRYSDIVNATLYGRLSLVDLDKRGFSMESDSIKSQRDLMLQFCDQRGIKYEHEGYYDDGITGLTFDRDEFKRLIDDIEAGKVDCVITKDLSRLGRDHSETGYYIERYFPEHNIRYISINDNWDSKYDSVDLILWKLAYNDVYCADISKKVKSGLLSRKRQGMWLASFAPYGYMKDPEDKHHLIVDPETGPIVKEIFNLAYSGLGTCAIAKLLTEKGYETPGEKCGRYASKTNAVYKATGHIWTTGHVRRILSHEVYIGVTAQCKIRKASYKSKKLVRNNKEDWVVVSGTHEPLISEEIFYEIQKRLEITSKKYTRLPGEGCLLSKLLFCKDCGHRISVTWKSAKYHEKGKHGVCNYYKKYSKYKVCTPHYIDYEELEFQVLDYIKQVLRLRLEYLDTPKLIKENFKNIQNNIDEQEKRLSKLNLKLNKSEEVLLKIYEDKINEKITESMYETLSSRKNIEVEDINKQINNLKISLNEYKEQLLKSDDKIREEKKIINKFLNSKIVTQDLLNQLIDRIEVGEKEVIDIKFSIKELNAVKI